MKLIFITLLTIFFTSCEGMKVLTITIISSENEQPISNADVYFLNRKGIVLDSVQTNSIGQVIFDSGFTGMMFGGPKFRYRISKDGYVTLHGEEKWPQRTMKMMKQ
ncbi:MAG: hypothetical protein COA58_15795 [Bacteroidetes bacterium]|nr:MAG: hypothetical protein COA58_15795 [Bacteroidota bacterium]